MTAFVVDVNVAIVANGRSPQANDDCVLACIALLESVCRDGIVVLDDGMRILSQYLGQRSMAGQPGPGDFFMKWVWDNRAVSSRCERVALACRGRLCYILLLVRILFSCANSLNPGGHRGHGGRREGRESEGCETSPRSALVYHT